MNMIIKKKCDMCLVCVVMFMCMVPVFYVSGSDSIDELETFFKAVIDKQDSMKTAGDLIKIPSLKREIKGSKPEVRQALTDLLANIRKEYVIRGEHPTEKSDVTRLQAEVDSCHKNFEEFIDAVDAHIKQGEEKLKQLSAK
jgi:hypothetical protein